MNWQAIFDQARSDFIFVFPEAMLVFFGLAILLTDFLLGKAQKSWNAYTALGGVLFSGASLYLIRTPAREHLSAFDGAIVIDPFFIFFGLIFLAATALVLLLSIRYLDAVQQQRGEYYALALFATAAMLLLACGNDLAVLFLALETMSISFYVLTGFLVKQQRSNEAAIKYMLMGAFSSGVLAYGFSILYGLAGSTNLVTIQQRIADRAVQFPHADLLAFLGLSAIAAGLFFKVAAVPFHQWAPDVYEGAPTTVTAYISVASKAAAFALLLRLFLTAFWPVRVDWTAIFAAVAVLSMTLGTLAALTQQNIKRLLAYSSIAQIGYMLLGLVASVAKDGSLNQSGLRALAFYLFAYAFFNMGAFAVVIVLQRRGAIGERIDDLRGLGRARPAAALLMLLFLLSLAGIPPTAGFVAKLLIFWSLIETGHPALAVLGVLYIVPAVYYYFRVVAAMWAGHDRTAEHELAPMLTGAQKFALGAAAAMTLVAGIFPEQILRLASYGLRMPLSR
jgi:NADH-quinone oxidoreductase subunit N